MPLFNCDPERTNAVCCVCLVLSVSVVEAVPLAKSVTVLCVNEQDMYWGSPLPQEIWAEPANSPSEVIVIVDEPDWPDSTFIEVGFAATEKSGTSTVTVEREDELPTKFPSAGV